MPIKCNNLKLVLTTLRCVLPSCVIWLEIFFKLHKDMTDQEWLIYICLSPSVKHSSSLSSSQNLNPISCLLHTDPSFSSHFNNPSPVMQVFACDEMGIFVMYKMGCCKSIIWSRSSSFLTFTIYNGWENIQLDKIFELQKGIFISSPHVLAIDVHLWIFF